MLNQTISYRIAREYDVPNILNVIQESFEEYRGKLNPPSSAHDKTVKKVQEELAAATVFVAQDKTTLVGCVFFRRQEDYIYLNRLSVLPAWRKMGIAGELIGLVEQQTIKQGLTKVRLSVRLALLENQAYYQKKGYEFKHYGTHSGYTEPTYMVLEKQLRPSGRRPEALRSAA